MGEVGGSKTMAKMQLSQDQYDTILSRLLSLEDPTMTHPCTKETDIKLISEAVTRIENGVTDIRKAVFGNGQVGLAETARKNAAAILQLQEEMKYKRVTGKVKPEKITLWIWFRDKALGAIVTGIVLFVVLTFVPQLMVLIANSK
jgi:hypothetical protein